MQTTILFKTDKKLKLAAMRTAKKMGIPFSAVLNEMMQRFVDQQEITFTTKPLVPSRYLERVLIQGEKDLKTGKNIEKFASTEEAFVDLM